MVFFGDSTSRNIENSKQLTVLSLTYREQQHLVAPALQNTHEKVLERHAETPEKIEIFHRNNRRHGSGDSRPNEAPRHSRHPKDPPTSC